MKILVVGWHEDVQGKAVGYGLAALRRLGHTVTLFPYLRVMAEVHGNVEAATDRFADLAASCDRVIWWQWFCLAFLRATHARFPALPYIMFNWDAWEAMHPPEILRFFSAIYSCCPKAMAPSIPRGRILEFALPPVEMRLFRPPSPAPRRTCDILFVCANLYETSAYAGKQWVRRAPLIEVLESDPTLSFHLYGPNSLQARYPRSYRGVASYEELPRLYATATICLSQHAYAFLEDYISERTVQIMASGGGVLLVDPIHSPYIRDGDTCITMKSRRPLDIRRQVHELLECPGTHAALVARARECIREEASMDTWARRLTGE